MEVLTHITSPQFEVVAVVQVDKIHHQALQLQV
jgi:hypothetical protein